MKSYVKRFAPLAVAFALVASGCKQTGNPGATHSPSAKYPVTIAAANGSITIGSQPKRIVSISPSSTEMLFAIKAGGQVVAADDNSNYPAGAPKTSLSGFKPNVEAIAAYRPDLVVFSNDPGDLGASFARLGIPALLEPAANTLDDTYKQIAQLGAATGHSADAGVVVAKMKSDIRKIVASAPKFDQSPAYYHELDQTFYSATSKTFIGSVYGLLGLRNIADAADKDGSHYPQLSAEFIIQANPALVFLADTKCCGQSAEVVAKRPGWDKIDAVTKGGVVALDDDIVSRWGPRVVDFLRTVANAMKTVKP